MDARNIGRLGCLCGRLLSGGDTLPAARPAQRQSVEAFVERTKGLAGTKLRSFHETVLGTEVRVFGNVAVALAACEMAENNGTGEPGRRDAAPHQGCECMADRIAGLGYGEPVQANPQRNPQRSPGWAGWRVLEARLFDVSMEWVRQRTDREERPNYSPWARSALRQRRSRNARTLGPRWSDGAPRINQTKRFVRGNPCSQLWSGDG